MNFLSVESVELRVVLLGAAARAEDAQ